MTEDSRTRLVQTMAWALADDAPGERRGAVALDDLVVLVPTLSAAVRSEMRADILACWALRDRVPPSELVAELRALDGPADPIARAADRWAMVALAGAVPPPPPKPPIELGWEELGSWCANSAAIALPRVGGSWIADRALDVLRAVCAALLADDIERAGQLLRWLALEATPYDRQAANALGATLQRARAAKAYPVLAAHRIWQARTTKELGGPPPPPPRAAPQLSRPPIDIVDPAIAWFVRRRDEFTAADRSMQAVRRLGELGVLGDQLLRHGRARGKPHWTSVGESLLQHAWDQLDRGAVLAELIETQPVMAINVTVYWLFHRHGRRSESLERSIATNAHHIPESLAYLAACAMREVGLTSPWPVELAYEWTAVGRGVPPWRLSPIEVYLVTHVAFYNSSFGARDRPFAGRDYLGRWLPVWLRHYEQVGAYDLLAEMIFTWHCVEDACCPQRAWHALAAAQQPDGSIPFSRDGGGDDYHSTLMAITAALQCRHA